MRICKQVKFIQATDLQELEAKLNEALLSGAELKAIDIASLTGAVIVSEYVGEIEKTALDELEDELGRHYCEECPRFRESTDKRKKWHTCDKDGKRVQKTSCCCAAYYELLREEVASEISEDQRDDGLLRFEGRGRGGMAEGISASGLRQANRAKQIPSVRNGIPFGVPEDTNRRIIQGGVERCYTRLP